jgi:phospholipid/cholesterol/gamma-HCH transport system substrate-binding protein
MQRLRDALPELRKHLRDFAAIAVLIVLGLVTTWLVLQNQGVRIPVLEERPFELKAELETVQGVTPGENQALRVAGVRIGDTESVEVEDGLAVVTFGIERDDIPIYRDATVLMRPQTGLRDMFFELDPGTRSAGEVEEGGVLPVGNTAPDVPLDEILAALDSDSQAYLRLLLVGAGQGLEGRGRDLGRLLGGLGPINRDLERVSREAAKRRRNLARLVTSLNLVTRAAGRQDDELTELVGAGNSTLEAIARQDLDVRRSVGLLPSTLSESTRTLGEVSDFAAQLGPATQELRPFARHLDEMNASVRQLAVSTTPTIKNDIRPFTREARERVRDLRPAARRLAEATPRLTTVAGKLNRLGNMAAFNPGGAEPPGTPGRDEGYLYWAAWLGHNGNSVFSAQDANGLYRRGYFTASCRNVANIAAVNPLAPAITGVDRILGPGGPC